jgi:hypothetical protein
VSNYSSHYDGFTWVGYAEPPQPEGAGSCASRTFHMAFKDGRWTNVYTKTSPALLHFNGKSP